MKKNESSYFGLLPCGFADVLSDQIVHEDQICQDILDVFASYGYHQVRPPLIEFDHRFADCSLMNDTFRFSDIGGENMLALRSDMTPQVVRIARARLGDCSRPLRLNYAGHVVRKKVNQVGKGRQLFQVGAELVGVRSTQANQEILFMTLDALEKIGIKDVTIDLNLPRVPFLLLSSLGGTQEHMEQLNVALRHRDVGDFYALPKPFSEFFLALIEASGPLEYAIKKLKEIDFPPQVAQEFERLFDLAQSLSEYHMKDRITVDALEVREFKYHQDICFNLFKEGLQGQLARGGCYQSGDEACVGVSLFMDRLLQTVQTREPDKKRIFLPSNLPWSQGEKLRASGYVTVCDLDEESGVDICEDKLFSRAKDMGCQYIFLNEKVQCVNKIFDD